MNETFGECGKPKVGWQIDTFGHSREMASIMGQMGYDGAFASRADYRDRAYRLATKTPNMVWQGSDELGKKFPLTISPRETVVGLGIMELTYS